jgi:DNA-directed RNA polymerase specialized sigma24 family protein
MDSFDFDWSIVLNPAFRRRLRISNAADRDEAIQDACVRLLRKPCCLTPELLNITAQNCNKDRIKSERSRKRREWHRAILLSPEDHEQPNSECGHRNLRIASSENLEPVENDPSARLRRRETRAAIKHAVRTAKLSRDYRCALWAWLRDRVAEFANRWGVPEVTIRVRAKRAKDMLRLHLERESLGLD